MDAICLQGSGGSQGVYINACLIRAYHESRGEGELRNEIISTAFSHPIDCAAPHTVGFKVITLYPRPDIPASRLSKLQYPPIPQA